MAAESRSGDVYRRARRFKHLAPKDAIPKYIDSIASAIANATPQTAYAVSVDAITDAIVTASFSSPIPAREDVIQQILASARYKDITDITIAVQRKEIEVMKDMCDRMALLPDEVQKRVNDLVELQKQHDDFEKQMLEMIATAQANQDDMDEEAKLSEIEAIKARFESEFETLYAKRCVIVSGASEDDERAEKGVPNFWFLAMMNADKELGEEITGDDEMVLEYLTNFECGKTDNPRGLKFEFFFDPNPFFKNNVLTKVYHYSCDTRGRFDIDKAEGTDIEWTEAHTTLRTRKRKCQNCRGPLPETFRRKSFFNFFKTLDQLPGDEADDDKVQEVIHDCHIRDILQKTLFPRAVACFLDTRVLKEKTESMEKKLEEMMENVSTIGICLAS